MPLLAWDNIPLGSAISCSAIESALTADTYTDRELGESRSPVVPAHTVQIFNGNNISARGDMAARVLTVRLDAKRHDPENREFEHQDPTGWTRARRNDILRALYTILLGNPRYTERNPKPAETRFKPWWEVIGSALEYAATEHVRYQGDLAKVPATTICFRDMFVNAEAEDEQATAIGEVLAELAKCFTGKEMEDKKMTAKAITKTIVDGHNGFDGNTDLKTAIEDATSKFDHLSLVKPKAVSSRLRKIIDRPVVIIGEDGSEKQLTLRFIAQKHDAYFLIGSVPMGEPMARAA